MILSDLISIPQLRDREYPEAWQLMGASVSHCGKARLITHFNTTVPRVVDFPPRTPVHRAQAGRAAWNWRLKACCICYWELWGELFWERNKDGPVYFAVFTFDAVFERASRVFFFVVFFFLSF